MTMQDSQKSPSTPRKGGATPKSKLPTLKSRTTSSVSSSSLASTRSPSVSSLASVLDKFNVGDRVFVGGTKPGHIRFLGKTQFADGEWIGCELDQPLGKNNGTVQGVSYFTCSPNHGIFVNPSKVSTKQMSVGLGAPTLSSQSKISKPQSPSKVTSSPGVERKRATIGRTFPSGSSPTKVTVSSPRSVSSPKTASVTRALTSSRRGFDIKVGERVVVGGVKCGVLRFLGKAEFATGDWAGVELDEPLGKNNGSINGKVYFTCKEMHGLFAPPQKVMREGESSVSYDSPMPLKPKVKPVKSSLLESKEVTSSADSLVDCGATVSLVNEKVEILTKERDSLVEENRSLMVRLDEKINAEKNALEEIDSLSLKLNEISSNLSEKGDKEGMVSDLENQLKESKEEIVMLGLTVKELKGEKEGLEQLSDNLQAMSSERDGLKTIVDNLKAELKELRTSSSNDKMKCEESLLETSKLSMEIARLQEQLISVQSGLCGKEAELEKIRGEFSDSVNALSDKDQELLSLQEKIRDSEITKADLSMQLEQVLENRILLESQVKESTALAEVSLKELEDKKNELECSKKSKEENSLKLCEETESVRAQLGDSEKKIVQLEMEKSSFAEELSTALGKLELAQNQVKGLKDQQGECDSNFVRITNENEELQENARSLQIALDSVKAEMEQLTIEAEKSKSLLAERESLLSDARNEREQLAHSCSNFKCEIEEMSKKGEELLESVSSLTDANEGQRVKIETLSREKGELLEQNIMNTEENERLVSDNEKLIADIKRLEAVQQENVNAVSYCNAEKSGLETKMAELQEQVASKEAENLNLKQKLQDYEEVSKSNEEAKLKLVTDVEAKERNAKELSSMVDLLEQERLAVCLFFSSNFGIECNTVQNYIEKGADILETMKAEKKAFEQLKSKLDEDRKFFSEKEKEYVESIQVFNANLKERESEIVELQHEKSDLQLSIERFQGEVSILSSKLEDTSIQDLLEEKSKRAQDLEDALSSCEKELRSLKEQNSSDMNNLQQQKLELEEQLERLNAELSDQLVTVKASLETEQSQHSILQSENEDLKQNIEDLKQENERVVEEVKACTVEKSARDEDCMKLIESNSKLSKDNSSLQAELHRAQDEIRTLKEHIRQVENDTELKDSEIRKKTEEVDILNAKLANFEETSASLKEALCNIEELNEVILQKNTESDHMRSEHLKICEEIEGEKRNSSLLVDDMRKALEEREENIADLEMEIAQAKSNLKNAEESMKQLEHALVEEKRTGAQLGVELSSVRDGGTAYLQKTESEMSELRNMIEKLEKEKEMFLSKSESVRNDLEAKLSVYEEEIACLKKSNASLSNENNLVRKDKEDQASELEHQLKRLTSVSADNADLSSKLQSLQADAKASAQEIENLKGILAAREKVIEDKVKENDDLNASLIDVKDQGESLGALNSQLDDEQALRRAMKEELDKCLLENEQLKIQLKTLQVQTGTDVAKMESLYDENGALRASLEEANEQLRLASTSSGEVDVMEAKLKETEMLLTHTEAALQNLSGEREHLIEECGKQKNLLAESEKKSEHLLEENVKLTEMLTRAEDANALRRDFDSSRGNTFAGDENDPKMIKLRKELAAANGQIDFLNSVIADSDTKKSTAEQERDEWEAKYNSLKLSGLNKSQESVGSSSNKRCYCDVCEIFDHHDTSECPNLSDSHPMKASALHKERLVESDRPFCTNCEGKDKPRLPCD